MSTPWYTYFKWIGCFLLTALIALYVSPNFDVQQSEDTVEEVEYEVLYQNEIIEEDEGRIVKRTKRTLSKHDVHSVTKRALEHTDYTPSTTKLYLHYCRLLIGMCY